MKIISKEFRQKVAEDIKVNITNIEKDNLQNLPIQHRYHSILMSLKIKLSNKEEEFDIIYQDLYHYYKFDYDHTLTKGEIELYIRADKKYIPINKIIKRLKLEIELLEEVVNEFRSRSFTIKNAISILQLER